VNGVRELMAAGADLPYPPFDLVDRVCPAEGRDDPFVAYDRLGAEAKGALLNMLPDGWLFDGKSVLDFGCGAGRTLRHFLSEAESAEFWGTDIDAASIAWLKRRLSPPLHVLRNDVDPPLGFGDERFDLVWALSVFTHIPDHSLPWLLELHRLLKPGGLLITTYMGRWNAEVFTHEPWDEERVGMNVLRRDQGWDQGGPIVLMSDWWVREHWGRAFEILTVTPNVHGQTWVLMEKRDVEISIEELEEPADYPRELTALRHNLRQLERDLRNYYEGSRSWRLTRPLRTAARIARSLRHRGARS
jgi:SAM-dependent methyltransferase